MSGQWTLYTQDIPEYKVLHIIKRTFHTQDSLYLGQFVPRPIHN